MIRYHISKLFYLGRSSSTRVFLNNVDFITRGSVNAPGSLDDLYGDFVSDPETERNTLCSVIRLISCMYLNTSKPMFPPKTTAETLLSQVDIRNILAKHKRLLEVIRDKIWRRVRTSIKKSTTRSVTALQRHVYRAILYVRQIYNSHPTPLDGEGTVSRNGGMGVPVLR